MLQYRWKVTRHERHLWYIDQIKEIIQVTAILHFMLVRILADGDLVDVEIGEVGKIVLKLYEEEDVFQDMGLNQRVAKFRYCM